MTAILPNEFIRVRKTPRRKINVVGIARSIRSREKRHLLRCPGSDKASLELTAQTAKRTLRAGRIRDGKFMPPFHTARFHSMLLLLAL